MKSNPTCNKCGVVRFCVKLSIPVSIRARSEALGTLNVNLKGKHFMRHERGLTITFHMDLSLPSYGLVHCVKIFTSLSLFIFLSIDTSMELNAVRLKSKQPSDFYKRLCYRKPDKTSKTAYTIFVHLQTFYFCSKCVASQKTASFN